MNMQKRTGRLASVRFIVLSWLAIGVVFAACGDDDPATDEDAAAPDAAVVDAAIPDAAIPDAAVPDAATADAASIVCNDDSAIEPNDTINTATPTPVPELTNEYALVGMAICPADDADVLRIGPVQTGQSLFGQIDYDATVGAPLTVELLNSSGLVLAIGTPVAGDPNVLRAELANVAADFYYVRVRAATSGENNYGISMGVSGP